VPRFSLGVVDIVYAREGDAIARSRAAAADGFAHIDPTLDPDTGSVPPDLALPVGCPTAFPRPRPGWCSTPAPPRGDGMWERCVRWFRAAPGALLEPWAGAVVHDVETMRAMQMEIPGLRFLVDTGHVADRGEDVVEVLPFADHVQLRQGAPGRAQLHVDDAHGAVDFAAVLARLDALGYGGRLSIEHFDLPERGWPLTDPVAWANDLARHVRALMR
jgi:sugar phosphate isomerase/epimerase